MLRRSFVGLGLIIVLSLFFTNVSRAATYPNFGPQTYDVHKYYYFGDSTYAEKSRQGIDISVDPSSVSYQSVKATVTMDYNAIMDRQITKFIVLANGVNVDEFEPYFDTSLTPPVYKEYYYLDINVSDQYIGSDVYFQVVALHEEGDFNGSQNVFVVGWSQESPTVRLKPLPVTDSDTHGYLADILAALEELKASLEAKLDALTKAVEAIYTPSPEAEARADQAMDNLMDKLPMTEMTKNLNTMTDALEQSKNQLQAPGSKLTFGIEENPNTGNPDVDKILYAMKDFLDLTQWKIYVELFRMLMTAMIWVMFFNVLFAQLTPKLGI